MAVLLPKYPNRNPDVKSMADKIRENITGLINNPGKKPKDNPFESASTPPIPTPIKIINIEAPNAETTLKNTPW